MGVLAGSSSRTPTSSISTMGSTVPLTGNAPTPEIASEAASGGRPRCSQFVVGVVGGAVDDVQGVGVAGPVPSGWRRSSGAAGRGARPGCRPAPRAARASVGRGRQRRRRRARRTPCRRRRRARSKRLRSGPAVAAGQRPQAAVLERGVLEGEPEAGHRDRLGVEERGVLVAADLAADVGLLEDVHRLQQQRVRRGRGRRPRRPAPGRGRSGRTPGRGRAARGRSC